MRPLKNIVGGLHLWGLLLSVLWPASSNALSLGELVVQSGLSQPLHATIVLNLRAGEDGAQVAAALGTRQLHEQLGLAYQEVYAAISVRNEPVAEGWQLVLRSTAAVDEPTLNFVLQVSYGQQQILREYTALLEPPPAAVTAGPAKKTSRSAAASHAASYRVVDGIETYGPTRTSDVLGTIGRMFRPDRKINLNRVMLALFRQNQDAFVDGNINRLKAGYYLQLKDAGDIDSISTREAARQVADHYKAWRGGKAVTGTAAAAGAGRTPARRQAASVKTPKNTRRSKAVAAATGHDASANSRRRPATLVQEELLQQLTDTHAESDAMRSRVQQLEEKLRELQDVYATKSEQVERLEKYRGLQSELAAAREAMTAQAASDRISAQSATVAADPSPGAEMENPPASAIAAAAEESGGGGEESAAAPAPLPAVSPPAAGTGEEAAASAAPDAGMTIAPVSLWSMLALLTAILAAAAVAMSLLRRLSRPGPRQEDIDIDSQEFDPLPEPVVVVDDLAAMHAGGGEYYHPPGDVMVEAKLAVARGELEQAISVLKHALVRDSHNEELRLLLLETLFKTGNTTLFVLHANIYADIFGKETIGWLRIAELGRKLAPEMNVFATDADADEDEQVPLQTFITDETTGEDTSEVDEIGQDDDLALLEKAEHSLDAVAAELQLPLEPPMSADAAEVADEQEVEINLQDVDGIDDGDIFSLDDDDHHPAADTAVAAGRKQARG